MRTGKYHYLKYVTIWAVNIIAKTKGYSIERAYEINPLFGSLVESKIKYYEQHLKYVMQVAMSFQVFDDMLEEYGNFQKQLNEDTEFLKNKKYDWSLEDDYDRLIPEVFTDFKGNTYGPDEEDVKDFNEFCEKNKKALELNKLIMTRIEELHNKALSLSENRMKGYPRDIRLKFQELKQIALDQWETFDTLNKKVLKEEYETYSHEGDYYYYDDMDKFDALMDYYGNVQKEIDKVTTLNVVSYAEGMDYLKRRRSELDD